MFDGDYAGKEATLKTGQALLNQGLNVYVVQLPSGMDPDDYIRKYDNEILKICSTRQTIICAI